MATNGSALVRSLGRTTLPFGSMSCIRVKRKVSISSEPPEVKAKVPATVVEVEPAATVPVPIV